LGIPNIYGNADWDLGPTWCYIIDGQNTVLIDTGRFGNLEVFKTLLPSIDMELPDIEKVIITHSHEDHDGNLAEILTSSKAELWAHSIYRRMIIYHPDIDNGATYPKFPGSCRLCPMPEKMHRDCLPYQQKRSLLKIDHTIRDKEKTVENNLFFMHTPGHTPDSICIILEGEVIFTGDTLLPEITPHPTRAATFDVNCHILPEEFRQSNRIYGLATYIASLQRIASIPLPPDHATFPSHRLFYNNRFNLIHKTSDRANDIIRFHIDRCADILTIIGNKPSSVDEIAIQYFPTYLLKGVGKVLGENEISAHIEILEASGDICYKGEKKHLVHPTGTNNFLKTLNFYLSPLDSNSDLLTKANLIK
jgi:glyoxylase-like metal-dependent hydrolase (beta-lactamase superfamily II)